MRKRRSSRQWSSVAKRREACYRGLGNMLARIAMAKNTKEGVKMENIRTLLSKLGKCEYNNGRRVLHE